MFNLSPFFRRNKKILWLLIATFMVTFVSIQVSKVFAKLGTHYGQIAECSYTHRSTELQTPQGNAPLTPHDSSDCLK